MLGVLMHTFEDELNTVFELRQMGPYCLSRHLALL